MNENKKIFTYNYGGHDVTIETGRLAKQADGSVLVSSRGTQVLVTVCSARDMRDGMDFFPLLVEYTEKFYAAGKFLGGFMKREGRPTTQETLNARLIDRPLRPLFPEGYMFETVVSATVLSYNKDGDPDVLASLGAAAALTISDIPFAGPMGTCKVGRIDGKLVINPAYDQWENSDMELLISASDNAILMVEGEAKIVPEEEVLEALNFGHEQIKGFCQFVNDMQKEVGKKKREFVSPAPNKVLNEKMIQMFSSDARGVIATDDKMERQAATRLLEKKVAEAMSADLAAFGLGEGTSAKAKAAKAVDDMLYDMMRNDILTEGKRIAGRKLNEVRKIETEVGILDATHGSSLFTRGETQVMAIATLGGAQGEQMADTIRGMSHQKFYLHYNFPPFSVGEARGVRGVGRRELGHGNLAERAIKAVMPNEKDFAYTTRLVCETLESNGSSSMGSVCSGSMALYDAGVPLVAPVAGIAMGLISDGSNYAILTDILGDEDHLGDMDFKVAGTDAGVTAIQMDIKIAGLSREIMEKAMHQAREGRLHILGEMAKTISGKRPDFKDGVPRIETVKIETDKIGALIGPGGKNIKKIQEDFGVTLEVAEDGLVKILGTDRKVLKECAALIGLQITGAAVGTDYDATVVTLKEYGAFVDIAQGVSGLVHVSELTDDRVNDVADYVAEGDIIKVRVMEVDRMGRMRLSAKAVKPIPKKNA